MDCVKDVKTMIDGDSSYESIKDFLVIRKKELKDNKSTTHSETPIIDQRKKIIDEKLKNAFVKKIYKEDIPYYEKLKKRAIDANCRPQFDKILIDWNKDDGYRLWDMMEDLVMYNENLLYVELRHLFRLFIIEQKQKIQNVFINVGLLKEFCGEKYDEFFMEHIIKDYGFVEYNPGVYRHKDWLKD